MKTILTLLFTCLIFASSVFAQDAPGELDLIILKNGTRLYGKIQKNIPGETITMTTKAGSEMTINYTEIKAVVYDTSLEESEPPSGRKSRKKEIADRPIDLPANRAYFSAGGGFNVGTTADISAYLAGGYRIGSNFIIAGGLQYIPNYLGLYLSPFAEAKYNFMKTTASPYLSVKSGVLFPIESFPLTKTTFNINPTLGMRMPSKSKIHSTVYIGYMYLPYKDSVNAWSSTPQGDVEHLFSIGGGIEF